MRISVTVLVIITPIWKYRVIVLRPTPLWPPWPSQDSLAGCNPRLPYVFIQVFSNFCFDKQTFARNVAIRYVILLIFAMDVYRLPQIYVKHRRALHQNMFVPTEYLPAE